MAANYVLLEKITVGAAGAASVTFSGIPQTGYTDLVVKTSLRIGSTSSTLADIYFNGETAASHSTLSIKAIEGDGATASSFSSTGHPYSSEININTTTANTFASSDIYIPNYTSSNYKSYSVDGVSENNAATTYSDLIAGLWSNTAAITSIMINGVGGTFTQYSTFYLYGVAKLGTTPAIVPYATGGDTIMTDGTYWYHAFLSSGTFTPLKGLTCDMMVVAGGASGGVQYAGGGGAGGLLTKSSHSVTATAYTVTIGAGGAATATIGLGNAGNNTTFDSIVAVGGGAGAYWSGGTGFNGSSGGSGGGGGMGSSAGNSTTGGAATQGNSNSATGYGNAGGGGYRGTGSYYLGGGGGGAGAVGTSAAVSVKGNGGVGLSGATVGFINSMGSATNTGQLSGGNYYYAGGGGGGVEASGFTATSGGLGGGGAGGISPDTPLGGTNGSANMGAGGGGTHSSANNSGAGGSGIVIVRYAV